MLTTTGKFVALIKVDMYVYPHKKRLGMKAYHVSIGDHKNTIKFWKDGHITA